MEAEKERELPIEKLNHRVKTTLATVQFTPNGFPRQRGSQTLSAEGCGVHLWYPAAEGSGPGRLWQTAQNPGPGTHAGVTSLR